MNAKPAGQCCPPFDPVPWNETLITWDKKRFVQDRVTSFLHIPLNFGTVMTRTMQAIEAAEAVAETQIVLADENSLWGADVYVAVAKDVPGARMTSISGTFLSKVFEGPFSNMGKWIKEMQAFVAARGKPVRKFYFYYTTCPKCAKKYGRNYVVILAQVE